MEVEDITGVAVVVVSPLLVRRVRGRRHRWLREWQPPSSSLSLGLVDIVGVVSCGKSVGGAYLSFVVATLVVWLVVAVDDDAGAGGAGGRRRRQDLALELTLRMLALAAGDGTDGWETAGACIVNAAREMLGMVLMRDGALRVEMAAQWPRPLGLVETAGGTDSLNGWYVHHCC